MWPLSFDPVYYVLRGSILLFWPVIMVIVILTYLRHPYYHIVFIKKKDDNNNGSHHQCPHVSHAVVFTLILTAFLSTYMHIADSGPNVYHKPYFSIPYSLLLHCYLFSTRLYNYLVIFTWTHSWEVHTWQWMLVETLFRQGWKSRTFTSLHYMRTRVKIKPLEILASCWLEKKSLFPLKGNDFWRSWFPFLCLAQVSFQNAQNTVQELNALH